MNIELWMVKAKDQIWRCLHQVYDDPCRNIMEEEVLNIIAQNYQASLTSNHNIDEFYEEDTPDAKNC